MCAEISELRSLILQYMKKQGWKLNESRKGWVEGQIDIERYSKRYSPLIDRMMEWGSIEDSLVLDSGCGMGRVSILLIQKEVDVVSVDIDMERLKIAKLNGKLRGANLQLVCANTLHLPFREGLFDLIFSIDVTKHVGDPKIS